MNSLPTALDEGATLRAARNGDREAFGVLVRTYQRRAYAAAYVLVRNRDDALDIAQEAFLRAYRAMDRFDVGMPFYPWLHTIIRNTALNRIKKRNRRNEISLDSLLESGFDLGEEGVETDRGAELEELRGRIEKALLQLTPEQQEIIRLRHMLDMSYAEMADCLEIPSGTVMSRLHGARKALRKQFEAGTATEVNI